MMCRKTLSKSLPVYSSCELYPIHTPLTVLLYVLVGYILPGACEDWHQVCDEVST
jgi:hypothetical protein